MSSFDVTRSRLVLDARDPVTKWCNTDRTATSTIECMIRPKGAVFTSMGIGYYAKYEHTGYTDFEIFEGDYITDANGSTYEVSTREAEWWGDSFGFYILNLRLITPYPST